MAFLITDSAAPLLMETVPACKITHFAGTPAHDNVYSYLRCYVYCGALHTAFTSFDAAPLPTAYMALCLRRADAPNGAYLRFTAAKDAPATLSLCEGGTGNILREYPAPALLLTAGSDEQGLFWCRSGAIPADVLADALGAAPKAGDVLAGNIFLCDTSDPASFGAAFPVPAPAEAPTDSGFGTFTVVPY